MQQLLEGPPSAESEAAELSATANASDVASGDASVVQGGEGNMGA